jgi:hypothetical protein
MNEGTPLGVKGTISHKAVVPYTTPNCGLYLTLPYRLYGQLRHFAERTSRNVHFFKNGARICLVPLFFFVPEKKMGPIIVVALTAHQTPILVQCYGIPSSLYQFVTHSIYVTVQIT